ATGVAAPKPKASARKKRGDSDTSLTPLIATPTPITTAAPVPRLSIAAKVQMKELVLNQGGSDEVIESEEESDEEETRQEEEESFDRIPRTPEGSEDEGNDEEDQDLRLSEEARIQEEEEADELYHDSLETTFFEYRQTNSFVDAVSAIPGIVHQYMTHQMTEAVREAVQMQTDRLQDSFQRENDEFLRNIDENMKKIIKGQVKSQVKEQVSRILPRIEESVNATLEAKVLTRSSHSSRTSYDVAADLLEMELKKILDICQIIHI
nr:hypothetical protein [Tanacetum cinerariifolium]